MIGSVLTLPCHAWLLQPQQSLRAAEMTWLHRVPVVRQDFWAIGLDSIQVNGKKVPVSATRAAIDTGTTVIAMTDNDARALNAVSHQIDSSIRCLAQASLDNGSCSYWP